MTSHSFVKIAELENQIESQIVEEILDQEQIPYYVRPYQDMAYDGIFAMQLGWGALFVAEDYAQQSLELLQKVIEAFKTNEIEHTEEKSSP